jgi:hypothetical protein
MQEHVSTTMEVFQMSHKKSRIRFPMFTGALLAALTMNSGLALADDHGANGVGLGGGKSIAVPEIDVGAGGNALALLVGGVLLAGERVRSLRKR